MSSSMIGSPPITTKSLSDNESRKDKREREGRPMSTPRRAERLRSPTPPRTTKYSKIYANNISSFAMGERGGGGEHGSTRSSSFDVRKHSSTSRHRSSALPQTLTEERRHIEAKRLAEETRRRATAEPRGGVQLCRREREPCPARRSQQLPPRKLSILCKTPRRIWPRQSRGE